jgi:hypothetical protein
MDFIATLPFKATGRMIIMYDDSGRSVSAHKDHDSVDLCHEFIWLRTNFAKPLLHAEIRRAGRSSTSRRIQPGSTR